VISGQIFVSLVIKKRRDYEPQQLRVSQQQILEQLRLQQQLRVSQKKHLEQFLQQQLQPQQQVQPVVPDSQQDYTYYAGSGGGCFANTCTVMLYQPKENDFISLPISQLKKGDFVKVTDLDGFEGISRVDCMVVIHRKISSPLVEFKSDGLRITKNHPMRINGIWYRPKDMLNGKDIQYVEYSDSVYNMVLDRRCVLLMVNGIECVTLGHGIEREMVYDHFYGTEKVVERMSRIPGWENGLVTVHGSLRSKTSDDVIYSGEEMI